MVGQPVEDGAGQALCSEDLGPIVERQVGCDNDGARSLNTAKVENGGLRVSSNNKKSVLCKSHYKEWKKATKDDRDLERARYDKF